MTKRKAEILTGYEVRRIASTGDNFCYGAYRGEDLLVEAEHRKESTALTLLVSRVYQIHSRQVLDEQGWKCVRCGRSYGLQVHHRQYRSRGGTHRPDNLAPVCWCCHRRIHAGEITLG